MGLRRGLGVEDPLKITPALSCPILKRHPVAEPLESLHAPLDHRFPCPLVEKAHTQVLVSGALLYEVVHHDQ